MLVTIWRGCCGKHYEAWEWKVLAGNVLQTNTKVESDITKVEFVTPSFAGVKRESISGSASLLELEYWNLSNKKGLKMEFENFLESDRRLEGDFLQSNRINRII